MNVRIVAAVGEELGSLPGVVLGVGPVVAAVSAGRLLAIERPEAVVLIGTAGSFVGGPAIGSVIASSRLGFADPLRAANIGYIPRLPPPVDGNAALLERINLPTASVLTNLGVTTDPVVAARMGEGWAVEHMEAYSVACACAEQNIPFIAVLGITNYVGPHAHAEWLSRRFSVQAAVRELVKARLLRV